MYRPCIFCNALAGGASRESRLISKEQRLRMRFFDMFQSRESLDRLPSLLLRNPEFIETLQVEPKRGCRPKEMGQSQGRITCNGPPAVQDFRDTIGGDIEPVRSK